METKPLAGLTATLRLLLKVDIATTIAAIFIGLRAYLANAGAGVVDIADASGEADSLTTSVWWLMFVLSFALMPAFLLWIYRVSENLHALSREPLTFTPGWAVGWFFIPFANLYKPYRVMREIWRVCHRAEMTTDIVVNVWWALWVASLLLRQHASPETMRYGGDGDGAGSLLHGLTADGIDLGLSLVALHLVTRIADAYVRNVATHEEAGAQ